MPFFNRGEQPKILLTDDEIGGYNKQLTEAEDKNPGDPKIADLREAVVLMKGKMVTQAEKSTFEENLKLVLNNALSKRRE